MEKFRRLFSNKFSKSVMLIAGGTAFAQALGVLLSPFITRLYSPEDFGLLSLYSAVVTLLVVYSTLRYEVPIPIEKDEEKAVNLVSVCFLILVIFTLSLGVILLIMGEYFLGLFGAQEIYQYRMLLPLGVFLLGVYHILSQWTLREKNFKAIGKTKLTQSIGGNGTKIGLGLLGISPLGLIVGNIIKDSAGILTLGKPLLINKRHIIKKVTFSNMLSGMKRYRQFPLYNGPSRLMNTLTTQLPIIFIGSLYGGQILGLYALANSVITLPMSLIGTSVAQVFYGEVASYGKEDPKKVKNLTKKIQIKLVLVGSIPLIVLLVFGPFLFSFVFGESWHMAGQFARLMSIMIFFNFITTPISNVITVYEKNKQYLFIFIFRLCLVLLVFGVARLLSLNSFWAIGLYSIAMSINYLSIYLFAQWTINDAIKKLN